MLKIVIIVTVSVSRILAIQGEIVLSIYMFLLPSKGTDLRYTARQTFFDSELRMFSLPPAVFCKRGGLGNASRNIDADNHCFSAVL